MENRTRQEVLIGIKAEWSVLGKYREIFLDRHLPMNLKRNVFNQCLTSNDIWMPDMVSYKSISNKNLETRQRVMEKKIQSIKLKDRLSNTIIRQRTRVADIVQFIFNAEWKCARHMAQMKGNRWTS